MISKIIENMELTKSEKRFLLDLYTKSKSFNVKNKKFEDLEEKYKISIILILAFFENKIDSNLTINKILNFFLPLKNKSLHIKSVLEITRDLFLHLKCGNNNFLNMYTNFGFYSLFYIKLNQILDSYKKIAIKKIWTLFLFFCETFQKTSGFEISDKIDILATLVIKELCLVYEQEDCTEFVTVLKNFFGYSIEKKDLAHYSGIMKKKILEFDTFFFDEDTIQKYANEYLNSINKYNIDFLVFLEKKENIDSIKLTPLLKNTSRCISEKPMKNNCNTILKNISLVLNFKQVVNILRSPQKLLHSPNLKKELLIEDKLEEFSKMYQWYKEMTQEVILKKMIFNGICYQISEECSDYLEISSIRNSYVKVLKIFDRIDLDDKERVLMIFFKLFGEFMKIEYKSNEFDFKQIKDFFTNQVFLKSLFALSLEIQTLIRNLASFDFYQIINICEISFYNFWKILINFAKTFAKGLPKIIKRRIVELEYLTLLKYIWIPRKNLNEEEIIDLKIKANYSVSENNSVIENNGLNGDELSFNKKADIPKLIVEAENILDCSNEYIVKRLLNIVAERIYLITNEINISDEWKEKIWVILKYFIFENKLIEIVFSTHDFHLDWIIILSIHHVINSKKKIVKIDQLIDIYEKKVLCTVSLIKEDLEKFYKETFRKKLKKNNIDFKLSMNSKNDGDQSEKILSSKKIFNYSPLFDNLNINLAKKQIKNFASSIFANSRKSSVEKERLNSIELSLSYSYTNEKAMSEIINISRKHSFQDSNIFNNQKFISPLPSFNFDGNELGIHINDDNNSHSFELENNYSSKYDGRETPEFK